MQNKRKIFIHSVFPAPYRVGVFKELSKEYDLFVAFERNNDTNRSENWFVNDFGFDVVILDSEINIERYKLEIKKIKKYDIVLAYDYSSFSCMKLMIRSMLLGIPFYINCDGAFINKNIIKGIVKMFFIKRARGCLASGRFAKDYFLTFGAKEENIFIHNFSSLSDDDIIPFKISSKEKLRLREQLDLPLNMKIVISVGQFTHRKGFDILLDAWKSVDIPDALLVIIGGGEDKNSYLEMIKKEKINNVHILDFKPKQELFNYYSASDLFVMTTREDIWGLVINEAMACGLPVITTNKCVAGLELIEDGENGYIVPIDNRNELIEKMRTLILNKKARYGMEANNLEKIKGYTFQKVALSHIETFNKTIS